jgi:hypothetical protein
VIHVVIVVLLVTMATQDTKLGRLKKGEIFVAKEEKQSFKRYSVSCLPISNC